MTLANGAWKDGGAQEQTKKNNQGIHNIPSEQQSPKAPSHWKTRGEGVGGQQKAYY